VFNDRWGFTNDQTIGSTRFAFGQAGFDEGLVSFCLLHSRL
jgi:hypothetical protein